MKRIALLFGLALPATLTAAESFGKLTLADDSARGLKAALDSYKSEETTPILVKGTVKKVCEKEGCWMTLEDQGQSVHVFMKGHSFSVAQKIKDKTALAEGVLRKKVRTVAEQKHLLRDAGESKETIEAVKADKVLFEFEATGIKAL